MILDTQTWFFIGFLTFVLAVLVIDLGIIGGNTDKPVSFRESLRWTAIWVSCSLLFATLLYTKGEWIHGYSTVQELKSYQTDYQQQFSLTGSVEEAFQAFRSLITIQYLTGYFIEYSLSADNLFVILLIFSSFNVPEKYYKRILLWGVLGAIVFRFIFIFAGAALISNFAWTLYLFGGFLVYSGLTLFFSGDKEEKIDTKSHPVVRIGSKIFNVFPRFVHYHFVIRKRGRLFVTPLFLVLLVVEFSDLIFAVDSVPAIFGVTKDPYIVFFSNVFAIMGLRSLFFLLSGIMHMFHYLKYGLAIILIFIGTKMFFEHWLHSIGFNHVWSLLFILLVLGGSVVASRLFPPASKESPAV
jgi:tellurite resistance protein TerC